MVCATIPSTDTQSLLDSVANQSLSDVFLDKNNNIRVIVRVRPPNSRERSTENVIKVMGPHCLIFDPDEEDTDEFGSRSSSRKQTFLGRKPRDLKFAFDHVLDDRADNEEAYVHSAKFVVDGVLSGFNCSVFAYGATGAGKTHTMLGSEAEPGVMYKTMQDLYAYMARVSDQCCVDVSVSYLEVYNEDVRDLLMPKRCSLPVREDPHQGVIVQGLSLHKPQSMQELLHMLDFGNTKRSQHPTDANAESSRSHAVFQVFVRQKPRASGLQSKVRCAKMSLIDLAGSERATVNKNLGKRFREGANINKSLLALGNVINSLASGQAKGKHVPYRDSKLTRILKDSLGGNCRTVMIAAVSPSHLSYEDTYNTLRYAERTKSIKADVKQNVLNVDLHIHNYAKIVAELQNENRDLREKLAIHLPPVMAPSIPKYALDPDLLGLKVHIDNVYSERANLHRELMEIESGDRELQIKLFYKQQSLVRYQMICLSRTDTDAVRVRCESSCRSFDQRQYNLDTRRKKALQRLHDNGRKLELVRADCRAITDDQSLPEVLSLTDDLRCTEIQLADQKRQVKYFKKIAHQQQRELDVRDKVLAVALTALRQQFLDANESGLTLPDTYRQLMQLVGEQSREVVWADQTTSTRDMDSTAFNFPSVLNFPPLTPAVETSSVCCAVDASACRHTPKQSLCSPLIGKCPTTDSTYATDACDDPSPRLTEAAGVTPFAKLCLDSPPAGLSKTAIKVGLRDTKDSAVCNRGDPVPLTASRTPTTTTTANCDTKVNSLTVTKSKTDLTDREPQPLKVGNSTLTKSLNVSLFKPAATVTKETSVQAANDVLTTEAPLVGGADRRSQRSSAVRAMTFKETRNGPISYAEIVKSPPKTAETPLPACVISPIPLTPAAAVKQRTPAGSLNRIQTEYCNSPLLSSSSHEQPLESPDRCPGGSSTVRMESCTTIEPSTSAACNLTTSQSLQETLTKTSLSTSQQRRPLADQANVMTSRLPVRSPSEQQHRVQFRDDQENRFEFHAKDMKINPPPISKTASENAQKLELFGLPALSVPSERSSANKPGYMRMTRAAERKTRQHGAAGRQNDRNSQPLGRSQERFREGELGPSRGWNRFDNREPRTYHNGRMRPTGFTAR